MTVLAVEQSLTSVIRGITSDFYINYSKPLNTSLKAYNNFRVIKHSRKGKTLLTIMPVVKNETTIMYPYIDSVAVFFTYDISKYTDLKLIEFLDLVAEDKVVAVENVHKTNTYYKQAEENRRRNLRKKLKSMKVTKDKKELTQPQENATFTHKGKYGCGGTVYSLVAVDFLERYGKDAPLEYNEGVMNYPKESLGNPLLHYMFTRSLFIILYDPTNDKTASKPEYLLNRLKPLKDLQVGDIMCFSLTKRKKQTFSLNMTSQVIHGFLELTKNSEDEVVFKRRHPLLSSKILTKATYIFTADSILNFIEISLRKTLKVSTSAKEGGLDLALEEYKSYACYLEDGLELKDYLEHMGSITKGNYLKTHREICEDALAYIEQDREKAKEELWGFVRNNFSAYMFGFIEFT